MDAEHAIFPYFSIQNDPKMTLPQSQAALRPLLSFFSEPSGMAKAGRFTHHPRDVTLWYRSTSKILKTWRSWHRWLETSEKTPKKIKNSTIDFALIPGVREAFSSCFLFTSYKAYSNIFTWLCEIGQFGVGKNMNDDLNLVLVKIYRWWHGKPPRTLGTPLGSLDFLARP